jgi:uncharacterized membrane protein
MPLGPVQLLVLAFEGGEFKGAIRRELERLREADTIKVLDAVLVAKAADGSIQALEAGAEGGHLLLRLLDGAAEGVDMDAVSEAQLADAAGSIPPGSAAALLLIEHVWALPLREAVLAAGGRTVAETFLAEEDLGAVGLA